MTLKSKKVKELDKLFSEYIRLRDATYGLGGSMRCISCVEMILFPTCDCGHFIDRDVMLLRWDEYNAHAQCRVCNRFLRESKEMKEAYRSNLCAKIGSDRVNILEELKESIAHFNYLDLCEIEKNIKEKIKRLRGENA